MKSYLSSEPRRPSACGASSFDWHCSPLFQRTGESDLASPSAFWHPPLLPFGAAANGLLGGGPGCFGKESLPAFACLPPPPCPRTGESGLASPSAFWRPPLAPLPFGTAGSGLLGGDPGREGKESPRGFGSLPAPYFPKPEKRQGEESAYVLGLYHVDFWIKIGPSSRQTTYCRVRTRFAIPCSVWLLTCAFLKK